MSRILIGTKKVSPGDGAGAAGARGRAAASERLHPEWSGAPGAVVQRVRELAQAPMGHPRVLRIVARLNVGGPAQHTILLSAALRERYPTLLVTGTLGAGEADMLPLAAAHGVEVHWVPELGRRIRPWSDAVAFIRLFRLCRRLRPGIVHTHTAKAGVLGRLAAWLAGVPVRVHTFHGHVFRGYFGRIPTALFIGIERLLARSSRSSADALPTPPVAFLR